MDGRSSSRWNLSLHCAPRRAVASRGGLVGAAMRGVAAAGNADGGLVGFAPQNCGVGLITLGADDTNSLRARTSGPPSPRAVQNGRTELKEDGHFSQRPSPS